MKKIPTTLLGGATALAAGAVALTPAPAAAAELEVQFTGLDVFFGFDGENNIQTGPVAGDVDQLQSATFYIDGTPVGTIAGDIEANIGLPGFFIPAAGGTDSNRYEGGYFSLDFDTTDLDQGWVDLGAIDTAIVEAFYTGDQIGLSFFGRNTSVRNQQPLSRVPAFPGFDEFDTIRFSFVSTELTQMESDGHDLTQFHASGAGTLNQQTAVPEPAVASLLAVAGLVGLRRRGR